MMAQTPRGGHKIPLVDMGQLGLGCDNITQEEWQRVAGELHEVFTNIGFAYLSNHGIPSDQLNHVIKSSAAFFDLNEKTKNLFARDPETQQGYVAVDRESLHAESKVHELREAYDLRNIDGIFPDEPVPSLRQAVVSFLQSCQALTTRILVALALGLGLEKNFFTSLHKEICSNNNMSCLRLLHYPPVPDNIPENTIRCGAHTDYGTITLLFQDHLGGLQVHDRNGDWVEATPIPDTILINVGDLLQFWTADKFIATEHRVVIPREERLQKTPRRSVVFFVHPDNSVLITPLDGSSTYQPISAAAHTLNRFKSTYNY